MSFIYLLIIGNLFFSFFIFNKLRKEQQRRHILQAYIAGVIRTISDYETSTDDKDILLEKEDSLPVSYESVLCAIEHELLSDISLQDDIERHEKWLEYNKAIFSGKEGLFNGKEGFVTINYNLFNDLLKSWKK